MSPPTSLLFHFYNFWIGIYLHKYDDPSSVKQDNNLVFIYYFLLQQSSSRRSIRIRVRGRLFKKGRRKQFFGTTVKHAVFVSFDFLGLCKLATSQACREWSSSSHSGCRVGKLKRCWWLSLSELGRGFYFWRG